MTSDSYGILRYSLTNISSCFSKNGVKLCPYLWSIHDENYFFIKFIDSVCYHSSLFVYIINVLGHILIM